MNLLELWFHDFGDTIWDVFLALMPILLIFLVLQVTGLHLKKRTFVSILKGFVIAYVGLVLFMQGVHIAFLPVGTYFGEVIGGMEHNWILIPIGFVMGFLVAFAEPAVHVMIKQVEELTAGTIKSTIMLIAISLGVASAVMLAMVRLIYGISLWYFLVPGYIIVFILSKFVDPTFIAMAFDNGGVATGPMCSTFILALSVAVARAIPGRDPLLDGFGIVALIALAPIITTMLLSFVYKKRAKRKDRLDNATQEV